MSEPEKRVCPSCGFDDCREGEGDEDLRYGHPTVVVLRVRVPIGYCPRCTFLWTDHRADELRERAVDEWLSIPLNRAVYEHRTRKS